ncbi:uncharacterized protein LOC119107475 [Pollicipes pollicipes]|uniref:uncharacterized protein LOC119107475 n=1 Tax=Pollicipes pollicipes TaxID=41117 RepID=UPI001884993B|nr:uncharacterized protein LOC119107475 [Pollicipes pollicipes]
MAVQYNIPWHMLKGLDPGNSEICTLKGSVTTGLEPSARDEIAAKLKSVAFCARGRVFFDVKKDQLSAALKLRSLDHINVLVAVQPQFGFTKNKVVCLKKLRLLPRTLDWTKALTVWQSCGGFAGDPFTRRPDQQLEVIELAAEPASAAGDGRASARDLLDGMRAPVVATKVTEGGEAVEGDPGRGAAGGDAAMEPESKHAEVEGGGSAGAAGGEIVEVAVEANEAASSDAGAAAAEAVEGATEAPEMEPAGKGDAVRETASDAAEKPASVEAQGVAEEKIQRTVPGEAQNMQEAVQHVTPDKTLDPPAESTEDPATNPVPDATPDAAPATAPGSAQEPSVSAAGAAQEPAAEQATGAVTVPAFRATCFRAGGGKQGHAFSSNEGAENFGGAVQDLFGWKVSMKGYDLEVVLDVEFDMVSVGVSLTPRALFYRNLVKLGPTSLRSTVCFNLLMIAKPQPYEVVVDPLCGGGSISLEGAQAFPGTFHICGDNYPDAAGRAALNREFSSRQCSDSAQLPIDIFTWDCTRLPLRNACADVIVSDMPFGKRMGSKYDNRTLYPNCMEEMARICVPRYGRAVLLTQDKNTMQKTLYHQRIKQLWRCRASPYVNIGGLAGYAYLLQRTDYVRRPPPTRGPWRAPGPGGPGAAARPPAGADETVAALARPGAEAEDGAAASGAAAGEAGSADTAVKVVAAD